MQYRPSVGLCKEAQVNERLARMRELGQAPWVDELSREDIQNGGLRRMIDDGIVGVTSNPAIFQKAIAGSDLYDEQLAELAERVEDPKQMFWKVARKDVQDACDIFMPVHEQTRGRDGFISLEVQPDIAYDTEATVGEATRLHEMVDRPNLFVKIPATLPGLVAIENAKLAYQIYKQVFGGARWSKLAEQGANTQRLLWASTSTKNPDYPDTIYVDNLVGPDTVNTMPKKTIEAVMDHGDISPTLEEGVEEAKRLLKRLREAGLDYEDVTDILEKEGIQKFADPFNEMIEEIQNKSRQLVS